MTLTAMLPEARRTKKPSSVQSVSVNQHAVEDGDAVGLGAEVVVVTACGDRSQALPLFLKLPTSPRFVVYAGDGKASRSSRNSEAGWTPVTRRWSRARVHAT